MISKSKPAEASSPGTTLYGLYVLSLAVTLIGNLFIRMGRQGGWLPASVQIALAVLAAAPLVVAAVLFWRLLRRELDEMLQRIVLEGLAFALVVYLPIAALYVNLRAAGAWLPRLDPPEIVLTPAVLVAIGVALARRRYE
jgi:hypothetical protein